MSLIIMLSERGSNLPSNKLLVFALVAFVLAISSAGGIAFYLGAFREPVLRRTISPDYHLIYLEHIGPYNEIKNVFKQAARGIARDRITPIAPAALFLDDPGKVAADKLRSKIGYLVHDSAELPTGMAEEDIHAREVIQASFDGSPIIGSYKAYTAMKRWSADNHYQLMLPSLEIYYADGHVEYQLPIQRTP